MNNLEHIKGYIYALVLALSFSVTASNSYAQVDRKPIHNIVLIHGIAGGATTFEGMSHALRTHLSKQSPQFQWNIHNYIYESGREEKGSSYQYAKELTTFLNRRIRNSTTGLLPGDRISLIMHSQGGIVGGIWMYMSTVGRKGFSSDYIPYLDNYISIGTPFWGSRISVLSELNEAMGGLIGIKETHDMHPLSNKSFDSKISVLNLVTQPELHEKIKHIQIINVAARAPLLQIGNAYITSDLITSDSDMVVETPAANMNFLYGRFSSHSPSMVSDPQETSMIHQYINSYKSFRDIRLSDLYVVRGVHMSTKPEKKTSTTKVTSDCVDNLDCGHPTLLLLIQSLQRKQKHADYVDAEKNKGRTFYLILNIRMPLLAAFDQNDVVINEVAQGGTSSFVWNPQGLFPYTKLSKFHIRLPELYSYSGEQTGDVMINDLRILKVGRFLERPANPNSNNANTMLEISAPGMAKRYIKAPLRVDHTTFVDVDLN